MMRARLMLLVAACGWTAFNACSANAAYVVTFAQVDNGVVATGAGTLNFQGLAFHNFNYSYVAAVNPSAGYFAAGNQNSNGGSEVFSDVYQSISGPASFGTGGLTIASSTTGSIAGVGGSNAEVDIPAFYFSSGPLVPTITTWDNATLASLGLTTGTYVYYWGAGANADTFTINIPSFATGAVPEPASWAIMILGMGVVGFAMRRRQKIATRVSFAA